MKAQNILYLGDNTIYLKSNKNNKIIKYKTSKGVLVNGKIGNTKGFLKSYELLLQENKLNNKLFGEKIKIIVGPVYNGLDINILKNVFAYFNYRKIMVDNETKYYKLNGNNAYLNVFDNYCYLTYMNEYKKIISINILNNMFFNEQDLCAYIKYQIKDRELYLLGVGERLNNIFNTFEEKYGNKTYVFSNSEDYLIMRAFCL